MSPQQLLEIAGLPANLADKLTESPAASIQQLLQQLAQPPFRLRLYCGLWSGGNDNVYQTYFLANSAGSWSSFKPFEPGKVIGVLTDFVGDISEIGGLGRARLALIDDFNEDLIVNNRGSAVMHLLQLVLAGNTPDSLSGIR